MSAMLKEIGVESDDVSINATRGTMTGRRPEDVSVQSRNFGDSATGGRDGCVADGDLSGHEIEAPSDF